MDRQGEILGDRYRIGAKIGTGGMSDVYTATDELLGREVAIKMMRPDLARDTNFLERFRREAQNAAKLNHPAIVAVYDTGQTPDSDGAVPYIVMERVHGETLRDIIRDNGKMGLVESSQIMAQVCDALHFSHVAGIIHRDIKPANIMITNTGTVKVMDFGIARALSDSSAAMTQTAAVIGTAQYLSPEQARGKSADARSDIYAAACVLFELTTGQAPFTGESPFSVAYQHVQDQVRNPSTVEGMHLSRREAVSLDSIVLTAMAKDPSDRYDDAAQMATDLRRVAQDQLPLVAQQHAPEGDDAGASAAAGAGGAAAAGAAGAVGAAGAGLAGVVNPDAATSVFPAQGTTGSAGTDPQPTSVQPAAAPASAPATSATQALPTAAAAGAAGAAAGAGLAAGAVAGHAAGAANGAANSPEYNNAPEYAPYYQEQSPEPKRRKGMVALWTIAALALAGTGAWFGYQLLNEPTTPVHAAQVAIPDMANLTRAEAENRLRELGLEVVVAEQPSQDVPRGFVIGTEPTLGSTVPVGSTVTLVVSDGKEITEVPDLTGLTTEEALQALEDAKLELTSTVLEEPNDVVEKGKIITQNPPQGSQVSAGTRVSITVSTGPEEATVPNLSGQSLDTAVSNLENLGFRVLINEVDSPEPLNTILNISDQGQQLPLGSEITITVSRNNQFAMPNLVNRPFAEVQGVLAGAGWTGQASNVQRTNVGTTDPFRNEVVSTQTPAPGTIVSKNSDVRVDVQVFSILPLQ